MTTHRITLTVQDDRRTDSDDARRFSYDVVADVSFDEHDDAVVVLLECDPLPDDVGLARIEEDVVAAALSARRVSGEFDAVGSAFAAMRSAEVADGVDCAGNPTSASAAGEFRTSISETYDAEAA